MTKIKTLSKLESFNENLLKSFEYMILGRMITISKELRETVRGSDIGMQFMISSINEDETVNLIGRIGPQWKFKNIKLIDINFNS